ncbi:MULTISPECIES: DUF3710 domain-containing protein [unclassified Amycolatopsis]|uniref:DUF3710 domain-containing protein n=1 Tax=unclassified Amycolatopsis TaxID=2618356 RepID=UPI002E10558D|nr:MULTISPECIES: DUF3710 domain-containing protein [unclassified Amycolatopsis]WSJ77869.1 DUF3710 domain-containing protein [Amycolatopsis sp. NBC_01307]WSK78556.1 DUF3710 domain-containing protein [Amycolatopsis sp. NBC_01286]
MGIFGRKRRTEGGSAGRHAAPDADDTIEDDEFSEDSELSDVSDGPFDVADFEDDGVPRIDLGSVKVPVPDGSQVQVEMDPETSGVRAVHVVTEQGQITVSAYAAPRTGGLWREVSTELADQLRADGAKVNIGRGAWGLEISAIVGDVSLRFVGIDRPRWMLRGVIAGPQSEAAAAVEVLRDIVRRTIVDRGDAPMPVRTPLTITLPEAVAEHIAAQQQG